MNQSQLFLAALILCLCASASAQDSISREAWSAYMQDALPEFLCHEDSYFVECFEVDIEQCKRSLSELARSCLESLAEHIPDPVRSAQEGHTAGQMIGSCAGSRYDLVNQALKISTEQCNDPMYWAGRQ